MTPDNQANRRPSLAALYAELDRPGVPAWLDADVLAAHVAGELSPALDRQVQAALATSPALAALCETLAELQQPAAELAARLGREGHVHGHHRQAHTSTRHGVRRSGHHGLRWLGAAAALMLVVLAGWGAMQLKPGSPSMTAGQTPLSAPQVDAIFSSGVDNGLANNDASRAGGDRIFHSRFGRKST